MAAEAGRTVRLYYSTDDVTYTFVAGAREDSTTFSSEHIDITDKDSAGVTDYLDAVAVKNMSHTCTGLTKNATFMQLAENAGDGTAKHYFRIVLGTFRQYTGQWVIPTFELGAPDGDAITFTMTLNSAGAITGAAVP